MRFQKVIFWRFLFGLNKNEKFDIIKTVNK